MKKMREMKKNVTRNVLMVAAAMLMILCLSACSPDAEMPGFDVSVRSADSSVDVGSDGVAVQSGDTSVNVGGEPNNSNSSSNNNNPSNNSSTNSNNSSSNSSSNNSSGTTKASPSDALIPPGATVLRSTSGSLQMSFSKSADEIVSFYKQALNTLGAQKVSENRVGNLWDYTGTYDGGKSIHISVQGDQGSINVSY